MKLKRFFGSICLLLTTRSAPINALEVGFDFNLGVFAGAQTSLFKTNPFSDFGGVAQSHMFAWKAGAIVGAGTLIHAKFPFSFGSEYTAFLLSQDSTYQGKILVSPMEFNFNLFQKDLVFGQFIDIYCRIGLFHKIPIDWQINLGVAFNSHFLLTKEMKLPVSGFFRSEESVSTERIGVHVGTRFSFYFIFIGFDYSFFPFVHRRSKTQKNLQFNHHLFSVTAGILINPRIRNIFKLLGERGKGTRLLIFE